MPVPADYPIIECKTVSVWEKWLKAHHASADGVWIKFYKKHSNIPSVNYSDALDVALCYGWIDSQVKRLDELAYIQKFTPRRSKSVWSKINIERVEKLIKAKRMRPAGLLQVEEAKQDGRWKEAYDSPSTLEVPPDFLRDLTKHPKAQAFYESLNKSNRYAIARNLFTAKKTETRERRKKVIIEMLKRGEKLY